MAEAGVRDGEGAGEERRLPPGPTGSAMRSEHDLNWASGADAALSWAMATPNTRPGIYRHSKTGRLYRVHFTAKHSENLESFVVYETLYDNPASRFWIRPAAMFEEIVEVRGERVPRFVFVGEA